METLTTQLLQELLYALISVGMGYLVALLHKYLGSAKMKKIDDQLNTHQALAELVIRSVEELYVNLHGQEKLIRASDILSKKLGDLGFKMSTDDIHVLITGTLNKIRDEFAGDWKKTTQEETQPKQDIQPVVDPSQPQQPVQQ